jgi:signal transduction histidine kinase
VLPARASPERILTRYRWWFVATLVVLFLFVEFGRYQLFPYLDSWTGRLAMDLVILAGAIFYFGLVFDALAESQHRVERTNRELIALHEGVIDIHRQLSLEATLQRVVERAAQLLNARTAALALRDGNGDITRIVTRGSISAAELEQELGISRGNGDSPPTELAAARPEGLRSISVPVECKGPTCADLYVADRVTGREFTDQSRERLARFATAVSIAIDNARLQEQLRSLAVSKERVRIGGELHDGMAQILAYVNTKAQAVRGYLERGHSEQALGQLEQLATASRTAYTDAREAILALRTELGPRRPLDEALSEFVESWEEQSGIRTQLTIEDRPSLEPIAELQLLRIIQEALSNARKHSGAESVRVGMRRVADRLQVTVADDGSGFDPYALQRSDFPRFGLAIMRERAESVGGSMTVYSRPGAGTRVIVHVPLEA